MALLKISPIFVLAGLMMSGLDVLLAAPIATCIAAMIAMVTEKYSFHSVV